MKKDIEKKLLDKIADKSYIKINAYSERKDGKSFNIKISENINITPNKKGIDINVKKNTKYEVISIPVIITKSGLKDIVYNNFNIEDNSNIIIISGCAIYNEQHIESRHTGIHKFNIGKNCKVKYIERHYCEGKGNKNISPTTEISLGENSSMDIETYQIKGIDNAERITKAYIGKNSNLLVNEKIMTEKNQNTKTNFEVELNGINSSTHIISRAVAIDNSYQEFVSNIIGNNKCYGHVECDSIIKDNAIVKAVPVVLAKNTEANLIHEASIGKIAGEQLIKLMTIGLTKKEAEEEIIKGFLK